MTTHDSSHTVDVLIVGAGLAGLLAARALQTAGHQVQVVDKGRGVGGRMATRRIDGGLADHGAQFFTVRSPAFRALADEWLAEGLIFEWSRGWSDGSVFDTSRADGYPRYAVTGGFTAVPKHLARTLPVETSIELSTLSATSDGWQATATTGRTFHARSLILTPPVPQSLALLDRGGTQLHADDRAALDEIAYAPCICGLFHVDGEVVLPDPGALQRPGYKISWIADNRRKGLSFDTRIITVHAGPHYSHELWHEPDTVALTAVRDGLRPLLHKNTRIVSEQLKRWRYALPTATHPERTLLARDLPPLLFAGDAFGGPRIEGAALSGMAAADRLNAQLSGAG